MEISYNKLWKLLIDKGMNKTDLRTKAHLSSGTMAKLGKNENVSLACNTNNKSFASRLEKFCAI